MECLNLYQTQFRKPSLTVYCLDYSGSMEGIGREQMVEAMSQILIQENAEQNLLQASEHEVNILIPFEGYPRDVYTAEGNGAELEDLYDQVEAEEPRRHGHLLRRHGGPAAAGNYDLSQYTPAIILLTDGVSDGSISASKPPMRPSGGCAGVLHHVRLRRSHPAGGAGGTDPRPGLRRPGGPDRGLPQCEGVQLR